MTKTARLLLITAIALATLLAAACVAESEPDTTATEAETASMSDESDSTQAAAPAQQSDESAKTEEAVEDDSGEMMDEPAVTSAAKARPDDAMVAPELTGIVGWLNTEPFTLESQRGNVVLIDFWTYTCINCIRTLPYLKEWHEKYVDEGLVIIGVHTPEFEFEKELNNVKSAVQERELKYAIAQDNEFKTWDAYENRFWPAKYLIDKDGYVRYEHFGEGAYDETEMKIRELLSETGASVEAIAVNEDPFPEVDPLANSGDILTSLTRELYAGYHRNYSARFGGNTPPYIVSQKYYEGTDTDTLYEAPGEYVNHFLYLHGLWNNGPESIRHARVTDDYEDYIAIAFYANNVNVVMSPQGGDPYHVRVIIDEGPLDPNLAGTDVMFDADGNSYVVVDEARMYEVVRSSEFVNRELRLSSNSTDFSLFAYTFGAYKEQATS